MPRYQRGGEGNGGRAPERRERRDAPEPRRVRVSRFFKLHPAEVYAAPERADPRDRRDRGRSRRLFIHRLHTDEDDLSWSAQAWASQRAWETFRPRRFATS